MEGRCVVMRWSRWGGDLPLNGGGLEVDGEGGAWWIAVDLLESGVLFEVLKALIGVEEVSSGVAVLVDHLFEGIPEGVLFFAE